MLLTRTRRETAPAPWPEMTTMRNRIRQLLETPFDLEIFPQTVGWLPAVEVSEKPDELVLTCELPGMKPEDVEINLDDGVLTIRGEKKEERMEGDGDTRFHLYERSYGAFTRSFTLPREVNPDGVRADFDNGVLMLRMPKTERAKGRKIDIAIPTPTPAPATATTTATTTAT